MINKESTRERTTFSLGINLKDDLENQWLWLRHELKGQNISKSIIIEEATKIALEDLKSKKQARFR